LTNIADIRTGLRNRLATIAGLHVYTEWPDTVTPPAALIRAASAQHEQTFGAGDAITEMQIEIHMALALKGGLGNAQKAIELYLSNTGTSSVRVAIVGDRTLGGIVDYTFVRGWRAYDTVEINNQEFLGAIVDVEVRHS